MLSLGSNVTFLWILRCTNVSNVFYEPGLNLLDSSSFLIFLVIVHENKIREHVLGYKRLLSLSSSWCKFRASDVDLGMEKLLSFACHASVSLVIKYKSVGEGTIIK